MYVGLGQCERNKIPQIFEGDEVVLKNLFTKTPHQLHLHCGGSLGGALATSPIAVIEELCTDRGAVRAFGTSVGTTIALGQVLGKVRQFSTLCHTCFCSDQLFQNTCWAWITNTVLKLEYLHGVLAEHFQNCAPYHEDNKISIALTHYETGELVVFDCDPHDIERLLLLVVASCTIPGATPKPTMVDGELYVDGMVSDPLPVAVVVDCYSPQSLLINIPFSLESMVWSRAEWLYFNSLCRWVPAVIREHILSRAERFQEAVQWIRAQLQLPIGHVDRVLPPTGIIWGNDEIPPFECPAELMEQAMKKARHAWREKLKEVAA